MNTDYWQKQADEPLFPDILWSRPENKAGAGKLAIVGGNAHAFSAPGMAYDMTLQAGAGVVHDSDPQSEANETRAKAQAVITAIQSTYQG